MYNCEQLKNTDTFKFLFSTLKLFSTPTGILGIILILRMDRQFLSSSVIWLNFYITQNNDNVFLFDIRQNVFVTTNWLEEVCFNLLTNLLLPIF